MTTNFRNDARLALERARAELATENAERVRYAALQLRLAMEALTYDRAHAYSAEIPRSAYDTWQPRKVLQMLLEIDPDADKDVTIGVGSEDAPGVPPREMTQVGTDNVLSLATLKKHYDALGAYLHMPTLKQLNERGMPDLDRLRTRCEEIASVVERALSSRVFNVTLGTFATVECKRCKNPIRKRLPRGQSKLEAKCFECGAEYSLQNEGDAGVLWTPAELEVRCPTTGCREKSWLWRDQIRIGCWWTCHGCGSNNEIGLIVARKEDAKGEGGRDSGAQSSP